MNERAEKLVTPLVLRVAETLWAVEDRVRRFADCFDVIANSVGQLGHRLLDAWGSFAERRLLA